MIRHALPSDLPWIAGLHRDSWRDAYRGMVSDDFLDGGIDAHMAERWAALPERGIVLVSPGGFVCCLLDRPVPFVDNLHAAPGGRRRGEGRRLMARLAAELAAAGRTDGLSLTVMEANARARAFYEAMGGREGAPRPERFAGATVAIREVSWDKEALAALASLDGPRSPA